MPLALFVCLLIVIGTMFYSIFEEWTYLNSFYFTIMTLTTVGYGDMYPTTMFSKLFTSVYVLVGVSMMLYALSIFTKYYIDKRSPNIHRAVTQTLEHMVHRKKKPGEVVLKVKVDEKKKSQAKN